MRQRTILTVIILFIGLFLNLNVFAQTNYANIKVDELSDAQIIEIIKRAESIGYNESQLEQMASAQGMKREEIEKLRLRVDKVRKQGSVVPVENKTVNTGRENSETVISAPTNEKREKDEDIQPKIFGSELFRNGNITFEPNLRLATPKGYVIGPDDKLLIDLNGDNEVSYNLQVSAEGTITLQYVGRIAVGGLTIDQATSKIRTEMAKTYPSLRSGRTTLAINLGNIRSIKVTITGQVVKSGTFSISSLSTVYNALYFSGGPSQNGSFRNIQIIRNNKIVGVVDVYDFLLRGIQGSNIRLQDQDVINIPVYEKRVEIIGEVKVPALFEMKNEETLQSLINFAGGFTTMAYTAKIKTFQNTDKERKILDITAAEFNNFIPRNGDKFVIEPILDRFTNRVEILGSVFRPGSYELEKGMTLKGLIKKADGLTEDAFLNRGLISRLKPDNTLTIISFDLTKILNDGSADIPLTREDKITIYSLFDLKDEYNISIQGEVRAAGTFEYAENLTLAAAIQLAGGFREGASPKRISVSRRVKNSDVTSASARTAEVFFVDVDQNLKLVGEPFILQPFDIVTVYGTEGYEIQKQLTIVGEVMVPGVYTITRKDERISDLIKRAGGLTPLAYVDGSSLQRPSGNNAEDRQRTLRNLRRLQEAGAKDSSGVDITEVVSSDLVGINLSKILAKPGSDFDLIIQNGDIVNIPRLLQTVRVSGEVLNPNNIVYLRGKSFKQYLNSAGGLTFNAYKKGIHVKYANGSVEAAKRFLFFNNYPIIKPGAEIIIPKRAQRDKLSAQAWIGIGTGIASLAAIIVSLMR